MSNFSKLLTATKERVMEVDPDTAQALLDGEAVLLDVREGDEVAQGAVPGSVHTPRGHLESRIESLVPARGTQIVAMCAGGVRSVFAADTLSQLGYTNVVSLIGGFNRWKDEGRAWEIPVRLSAAQRGRYSRHLLLPEVGETGQLKLLGASVLVLGAGGLGSPAALYLTAAGVGTIGVVDMDVVDESNLQRQILHNIERVGQPKVSSAKQTLNLLNPDVVVNEHNIRLDATNIEHIISGYDIVVDGADNFAVRYMLNDASVKLGIPVVHGSIFRFEGHVTVFDPRHGPTYRDMVPEPPPPEMAPSCSEAGVLGVLPGIVGSIQAVEALKLILGVGEPLIGRYLTFDASAMEFREYKLRTDPTNEITWENRDQIQVVELDGVCSPAPLVAAVHWADSPVETAQQQPEPVSQSM